MPAGSTSTSTSPNDRHAGSAVHRVGEGDALQEDGTDACALEQFGDSQGGPLEPQDLLHLVAMGAGEDIDSIVGELEFTVARHLQEQAVEPLAADLAVEARRSRRARPPAGR